MTNPKDRLIHKYLNSHADGPELENGDLPKVLFERDFQRVCVIPLCGEGQRFESFYQKQLVHVANLHRLKVLYILVVNSAFQRSSAEHLDSNDLLLKLWKIHSNESVKFWDDSHGFASFLTLNYHSDNFRFQPKQGVGLARKIGCDVALRLIQKGIVDHPLIYNTDGDAWIPEGYFSLSLPSGVGAGVAPFRHVSSSASNTHVFEAAKLYDAYLRYFCAGLEFAQSQFAYIPIGSCLIIDAEAYASVRGFPDRLAGEDFHILSKISKIKRVENLKTERPFFIELEGRESDRVPFGTGAKIREWLPFFESQRADEIKIESPDVFLGLKFALQLVGLKQDDSMNFSGFEKFTNADTTQIKECLNEVVNLDFHRERLLKLHSKDESIVSQKLRTEVFDGLQQIRFIHLLAKTDGIFKNVSIKLLKKTHVPFNQLFG